MVELERGHRQVLRALRDHQGRFPLNVSGLARVIKKSVPATKAYLERLYGAGLVDYQLQRPAKYVEITPIGRAFAEEKSST